MRIEPVFLFDLDGTLVDSVYQHVLAWKQALDAEGIELSVWRIYRKIGMSGGLFTNQLLRETGIEISAERVERLRQPGAAETSISQRRRPRRWAFGHDLAASVICKARFFRTPGF
jgi:beta-phosphoglucomutase-like phosphatase (HAD superfamily)